MQIKCCFGIAEVKNRPVVLILQHKTRLHARHAARSTALVQTWMDQSEHFYCFLLKPIRDNLAPGFPRALDLSPVHAQKSSGLRLGVTAKVISKQAHYFIFGLYGTFGLHNGGRRSDLLKVWKRRFLRLQVAAEFFDDDFHHTLPTSFLVSSPIRCISFWH